VPSDIVALFTDDLLLFGAFFVALTTNNLLFGAFFVALSTNDLLFRAFFIVRLALTLLEELINVADCSGYGYNDALVSLNHNWYVGRKTYNCCRRNEGCVIRSYHNETINATLNLSQVYCVH